LCPPFLGLGKRLMKVKDCDGDIGLDEFGLVVDDDEGL